MRVRILSLCCSLATASVAGLAAAPLADAQTPAAAGKTASDAAIAAMPLKQALDLFTDQTGLKLAYASQLVVGVQSRGTPAGLSPERKLQRLLEGTGIKYRYLSADTIALLADKTTNPQLPAERPKARQDQTTVEEKSAVDLPSIVVRKPFTDANVDIVRTEDDPQAYYIFGDEEILEANVSNIEDFLKQKLTMNAVSTTYSQSGSMVAGNISRVNLRGLGTDQTLILVNGRRTTGGGAIGDVPQFDLNAFSPAMIERVEVLPSSASAIYGGNAVGGVLNVILKRDFTGGDIRVSYDTPLDNSAPIRTVTAGYGWSLEDGRTHITLSAGYRDNKSLRFSDRPELLQRGISRILQASPGLLYSANNPFAVGSTPNIASVNGSPLVFDDGTPLGSSLTYVPVGTTSATSDEQLREGLLANAGLQNTTLAEVYDYRNGLNQPFVFTGKAVSLIGAVRRQMTDRLELIGEVFYNSNEGRYPHETHHLLNFMVPGSSPANPFQQNIRVVAPVSTVPNYQDRGVDSMRTVLGFVLDLPHDWRAQGDYTWNRQEFNTTGILFDSASGQTAAAAAFADGSLNLLVDTLQYPPDYSPYLSGDNYNRATEVSTLSDIGLRVSGPIGQLPAGQPNLTIGLGHRKEKQPWAYRDSAGLGLRSYFPQSQSVSSVYAEALIPIIAPVNSIPGVRMLDLQVASRIEDFSVSAGTAFRRTFPPDHTVDPNEVLVHQKVDYSSTNTTIALRYKPMDSLTLRASHATAFLPPSYTDLLPGDVDPVFRSAGVDPLRGNESFSVPRRTGGNPDLKPMNATSLNIGVIFEPKMWKGTRFSLEWFRIERDNLIFNPTPMQILANESLYPGRVTRAAPAQGDPYGVGPITFFDLTRINANRVVARGFDANFGYRKETESHGVFSLDLFGTLTDSFTRRLSLDGPEVDIAGQVANGGPLKLRTNATLGWERDSWSFSWTTLHYGSYDQFDNPLHIAAQGSTTVPHQTYHNILIGYRFPSNEESAVPVPALAGVTVALGIRNVFNTVPPFDAYQQLVQYYSPFGDYRLRSVQLTIAKRF